MGNGKAIGKWLSHRFNLVSVILFLGCFAIYIANGRLFTSGDSIPTSIWAFNLLENHCWTFDNLQGMPVFQSGLNYYFSKSANGQWVTVYPIGTALMTLPLYALFFLQYKLTHLGAALDLLSLDFEMQRRAYERLAATIITASSVVIFFQVARFRFRAWIALVAAIIFGFATTTWTVSSQALWQHGPLNFCVLVSLLMLLRAERAQLMQAAQARLWPKHYLLLSGAAAGWLIGIRPTAIVYIMPLLLYLIGTNWRRVGYFIVGLLAGLPAIIWNLYYFNHIFGGYSLIAASGFHQLAYFKEAVPGILFSPSRGFLIYTPVMLFALPGIVYWWARWRNRQVKEIDALFGGIFLASLPIFCSYLFVLTWWGGFSYGPRFYTDILPAWCLMLAYCLEWLSTLHAQPLKRWSLSLLFTLSALFSTFVQAIGVGLPLRSRDWNDTPYSVDIQPDRAWDWADSQISRHFQALQNYQRSRKLTKSPAIKQFAGKIRQIQTTTNQNAATTVLKYKTSRVNQRAIILYPIVQNLSPRTWNRYHSGIGYGLTYLEGKLFDQQNQPVGKPQFFLTESIAPQQSGKAIGAIRISDAMLKQIQAQPDSTRYRLDLSLKVYGQFEQTFDTHSIFLSVASSITEKTAKQP